MSGWRRCVVAIRAAVLVAGALMLVAASPIPRALAYAWALNAPPHGADAIVVLGAGVRWPDRLPCVSLQRLEHGVRLYHAGYAPRLILTGGTDPHHPAVSAEAVVMRGAALRLGVNPGDIVIETEATRTYENGLHVARLMHRQAWGSAIIVTDALHMRRAHLVFQRLGIRSYPSAGRVIEFEGGPSNGLRLLERLTHEVVGVAVYKVRGWV